VTENAGDRSDDTVITIALPLPMPVYGTLVKLVGAAYPDARMGGGEREDALVFYIPKSAVAKRVSKAAAKPIKPDEATDGVEVIRTSPKGLGLSITRDLAEHYVIAARETFAENPGAVNYVEHTVIDAQTHQRYVLTFSRSEHQTPHALRMVAERNAELARASAAAFEERLASYRAPDLTGRVAEVMAERAYESARFEADPAWEELDAGTRQARVAAVIDDAAAIAEGIAWDGRVGSD